MPSRDRGSRKSELLRSKVALALEPGTLVRRYCAKLGWVLKANNVIVEGTTDAGYFELASELHRGATGFQLIDGALAIIPVGERDRGGTKGLIRNMPVIRQQCLVDPPNSEDSLEFLVLVDDDMAGRRALKVLSAAGLREHRDIIKLCRAFPAGHGNPTQIAKRMAEANVAWKHLECEIEDLVSAEVLELFAEEKPQALLGDPEQIGSGHHFNWRGEYKPELLRHVSKYASLVPKQAYHERHLRVGAGRWARARTSPPAVGDGCVALGCSLVLLNPRTG